MTGLQKTMEVLEGMMNSICDWLNFTMESVDGLWGDAANTGTQHMGEG